MKKTVLITGASGGIGFEMATIFARNNFDLVLVARNESKLVDLKSKLESQYHINCRIFATDLSKIENAESLIDRIDASGVTINVLVNNAGFGEFGFFTDTSWEKELQMINLNITALTYLTKVYSGRMAGTKSGKIMNVASVAAFLPGPMMAVYYATKAYVLSFSQALANELLGTGVTVTALCPGPTRSGFQDAANANDSKIFKNKKLPTSREVAEFGFKSMMKGRRVAIHGYFNKLQVFMLRFSPRSFSAAVVRYISKAA